MPTVAMATAADGTGHGRAPEVVCVHWSHTGHSRRAIETFAAGLTAAGCHVRHEQIELASEPPFPWRISTFFRQFAVRARGTAAVLQRTPATAADLVASP